MRANGKKKRAATQSQMTSQKASARKDMRSATKKAQKAWKKKKKKAVAPKKVSPEQATHVIKQCQTQKKKLNAERLRVKENLEQQERVVAEMNEQLQALAEQLSTLESQRERGLQRLKKAKHSYDMVMQQLRDLDNEMEALAPSESSKLIVSEHAIVRYLQRIDSIDLEQIKKEILTEQLRELVGQLGVNGTFPTGAGFKVVMRDGVVITIKN